MDVDEPSVKSKSPTPVDIDFSPKYPEEFEINNNFPSEEPQSMNSGQSELKEDPPSLLPLEKESTPFNLPLHLDKEDSPFSEPEEPLLTIADVSNKKRGRPNKKKKKKKKKKVKKPPTTNRWKTSLPHILQTCKDINFFGISAKMNKFKKLFEALDGYYWLPTLTKTKLEEKLRTPH